MAIFAPDTALGICCDARTPLRAKPSTSSDSSADLPWHLRMWTAVMGYLDLPSELVVFTEVTAFTARSPKKSDSGPRIFEAMEVFAALMSISLPSSVTDVIMLLFTYFTASRIASRKPDMTVVGWILLFTSSLARFRSSEAMMTTEVVPSPTSWSCRSASSTSTFAAGWSTSSCFRIVAPSFVMVTSPIESTSI